MFLVKYIKACVISDIMVFDEAKARVMNGVFNLAGEFISEQLIKPDYDEQDKINKQYYSEMRKLVRENESNIPKISKPEIVQEQMAIPERREIRQDLTTEKIEGGTACLACIPPESMVLTESGVKQIDQISTDDKVLDRYGEYTETLNVIKRRYDGDMISILPTYQTTFPLLFTPEHLILTMEAEMCNKVRGYCIPGKTNKKCINCRNKKNKLSFLPASAIHASTRNPHIGDRKLLLAMPRITKIKDIDTIKIDKLLKTDVIVKDNKIASSKAYNVKEVRNIIEISSNFLKLVGFYLAEGSVTLYKQGGGRIRFHFGHHERKLANEVVRLIKDSFSIEAVIRKEQTTLDVTIYSVILARFFKSLFGTGSANKKLPKWLLYLPYEKQYSLLEGYFKGDGSKDDDRNALRAATVSKQLAYSLRQLLFRLGVIHGFSLRKNTDSALCKSKHKIYHFAVTGLSGNTFSKKINYTLPFRRDIRAHEGGIDDDFIYLPIKKVERKTYHEAVMNLTTHSNTYTYSGVCVHNCSRDHFSTTSAALNEALRFARKEGVGHIEVQRRLGMALDELNICERIDLAAETIERLNGREKEVAIEAVNNSRELRHDITAIRTPDDLQKVSAQASSVRTKFMKGLWDVATLDGSVEKLCRGLSGEEYDNCVGKISTVLNRKKS